jgi:hypothetical protein
LPRLLDLSSLGTSTRERRPGTRDDRQIDHATANDGDAAGIVARRFVGVNDLTRLCQLVVRGSEDVVDRLDLGRMDAGLAAEPD